MASTRHLRRPNVLAVDDKRSNLVAIDAVLGSSSNLIFAESGREAVTTVAARPDLDVILMDVQMPIMDGFETAQRIKQLPNGKDIPIVFITAVYSEDPFIKRGYEVGGIDYFSKPYDPEILKLKVAIYATFRQRADLLAERELRLKEIEKLLTQHVGVLVADADGHVTRMTDEAARILNADSPDEAYGELLAWWSADGQAIRAPGSPLDLALHRGESTHEVYLKVPCFDGAEKHLSFSASALRGGRGETVGAVLLIHDPSDTQRIQAEREDRVGRYTAPRHAIPW